MTLEKCKKVPGLITEEEGMLLYVMAKRCKGSIIEIGSYKGKSTAYIATGSIEGAGVKVYAIDTHKGSKEFKEKRRTLKEFKENIDRVGAGKVVTPMVMTSMEAARRINEMASMVFIDGSHEYEDVKADFEKYAPKVKEGGYIVFHDSSWAGPMKLIKEMYWIKDFKLAGFCGSMTIFKKGKKETNPIENRTRFAIRDIKQKVAQKIIPKGS